MVTDDSVNHIKAEIEAAKRSLESAEVLNFMPTNYNLSVQKRLSSGDYPIKLNFRNSAKYTVETDF